MISDGVLVLRPHRKDDLPVLTALESEEEAGPYNYFPDPPHELLTRDDVSAQRMTVATTDGVVIGAVSWFGVPYGPNRRSLAWRIGITILRGQRGRGYGARVQRLLAEHLLDTTDSNRVEADVDVTNTAERRALERAGFVAEGVLRGAQWRQGRWHDVVLYARTGSAGTDAPG